MDDLSLFLLVVATSLVEHSLQDLAYDKPPSDECAQYLRTEYAVGTNSGECHPSRLRQISTECKSDQKILVKILGLCVRFWAVCQMLWVPREDVVLSLTLPADELSLDGPSRHYPLRRLLR